MRGIYVLDLENCKFFIIAGECIQEALIYMTSIINKYDFNYKYDGSFHYYPIQKDETETDAEKRIFIIMAKRYGIQNILARERILESIGKGTWTSDMPLLKMLSHDSEVSFENNSEGKEVFSISL